MGTTEKTAKEISGTAHSEIRRKAHGVPSYVCYASYTIDYAAAEKGADVATRIVGRERHRTIGECQVFPRLKGKGTHGDHCWGILDAVP